MFEKNHRVYESPDVVQHYATADYLQKPEAAIVGFLRDALPSMSVLDLGVGVGRTTANIAPLVREYVAADYSQHMVEAFKKRFPGVRIELVDARDLSIFPDAAFDLVLFSFNGLGYMNHQDRITALKEIRRVTKENGVFVFSAHNRDFLHESTIPYKVIEYSSDGWAIINDNAHGYRLDTYYITVSAQMKQLAEVGFDLVQPFPLDGKGLSGSCWVYYMCRGNQ